MSALSVVGNQMPDCSIDENAKLGDYELAPDEKQLADGWARRRIKRGEVPALKRGQAVGRKAPLVPDHPSAAMWAIMLQQALGTTNLAFAMTLRDQLIAIACMQCGDPLQAINSALAALHGIAPRDEAEAMLAAQMVAIHAAAMTCHQQALLPDQTFEGQQASLNQANKLSRTYATLLEALNRNRGKGQQRIIVERVDVAAGGQAIVGAVEHGGREKA